MASAGPVREMGEYKVKMNRESIIGTGIFGAVYKCLDQGIAAKMINLHLIPNDALYLGTTNNAVPSYVKELQHPNVARILHSKYSEPELWIFMECCQGNLEQYLSNANPNDDTCASLLIQCSDGVSFLHDNNIIHSLCTL